MLENLDVWIYPGKLCDKLKMSMPEVYKDMEVLTEHGIIKPYLEIVCPHCGGLTGKRYQTVSDAPDRLQCPECRCYIDPALKYSIVVYAITGTVSDGLSDSKNKIAEKLYNEICDMHFNDRRFPSRIEEEAKFVQRIAIRTSLFDEVPKKCEDCIWYQRWPHPYREWIQGCHLTMHSLDDDQPDEWIYDGDRRPKACPLCEVKEIGEND